MGGEVTWSRGDFEEQQVNVLNPNPAGNSTRLSSELETLWTAVARLGYVFNPRWMAYIKGGYAAAQVDSRLFIATALVTTQAAAVTEHDGHVLGGGLSHLLGNNLVLDIDYSYMGFDSESIQPVCGPVACIPNPALNVDLDDVHMLVGRVSVKFGGKAPN